MTAYKDLSKEELLELKSELEARFEEVKEKGLKSKKLINQARRTVKKPVLNNIKDLVEETNIPRDMIEEFESFDEYEKLKIEEKALELCSKEMGVDINFLLAMKAKTRAIYIGAIKDYIERVMKEEEEN